jgi:DNA-binding FadR family transcriptional regulator
MLKRPREPGLKRLIQERIKQVITEKGLRPGELLPPEGQLAEDLGVSRGSVREAVKSLESLGIVESRHGEGVCVREFNFDSVLEFLSFGLAFQPSRAAEILQIREWLEESAAAPATEVISEAQLDEIDALLSAWEAKAQAGEPASNEDRSFHRMLYEPLGNASLLSLIDIFWVVYNALAVRQVAEDRDPLHTVRAHRELFAAVRSRDAALVKQRLRQHFRDIEERFAQAIEAGSASRSADADAVKE